MSNFDIILAVDREVINDLSLKVEAELVDLVEKRGKPQVAVSIKTGFLVLDEGLLILITIVVKCDVHIAHPAGLRSLNLLVGRLLHILLTQQTQLRE